MISAGTHWSLRRRRLMPPHLQTFGSPIPSSSRMNDKHEDSGGKRNQPLTRCAFQEPQVCRRRSREIATFASIKTAEPAGIASRLIGPRSRIPCFHGTVPRVSEKSGWDRNLFKPAAGDWDGLDGAASSRMVKSAFALAGSGSAWRGCTRPSTNSTSSVL